MSPEAYFVPRSIYPLVHEGGVVIFNRNNDQFLMLGPTEGRLLQEINATGSVQPLQDHIAATVSSPKRRNEHARNWLDTMESAGLLSRERSIPPKEFPTITPFTEEELLGAGEVAIALRDEENIELTPVQRAAAKEALELAVRLTNDPSQTIMHAVGDLQRSTLPPASLQEASFFMRAIHKVARDRLQAGLNEDPPRFALGRFACLELTLATVALSARLDRYVKFVLGVSIDPFESHAWPEASGVPIRMENDPVITGRFHKLLEI